VFHISQAWRVGHPGGGKTAFDPVLSKDGTKRAVSLSIPHFTNDVQQAGRDTMDDTTDLSSIDSNTGYGWPDSVTLPERTDAAMHAALQRMLALTRAAWQRPPEGKSRALPASANDDSHPHGETTAAPRTARSMRRHQRAAGELRVKF